MFHAVQSNIDSDENKMEKKRVDVCFLNLPAGQVLPSRYALRQGEAGGSTMRRVCYCRYCYACCVLGEMDE